MIQYSWIRFFLLLTGNLKPLSTGWQFPKIENPSFVRECPIKRNMRRFRPDGSGQGVRVAGYPWNGYPQCAQRSPGPSGREPLWGSVLFSFWRRCRRGPRPYGHWHLACALPKAKNACCDAYSDLLDTLSVAQVLPGFCDKNGELQSDSSSIEPFLLKLLFPLGLRPRSS